MQSFSVEEYRFARASAAFTDRSARGRIAVTGRDRLTYLHALLTNDIAALRPGKGCYTAYLTPQGRMVADLRVLDLGDLVLLDVEPPSSAVVLEKLEQLIFSEDVTLADLGSHLAQFIVYGPRSAEIVPAAAGVDASGLPDLYALADCESVRTSFQGASAVVAANDAFGVPAFDVYLDRRHAGDFQQALLDAGALTAADAVLDALRIEAGRPRHGVDMDETTIPLEAGIEQRAISFTKGCYPGQEVITRVLHRGHGRIAKKLVGVTVDGEVVPEHDDRFVAQDKEVGRVTSAILSPALGSVIALGYLQRDFIAPGTGVSIVHGDLRLSAKVVDLPFVR